MILVPPPPVKPVNERAAKKRSFTTCAAVQQLPLPMALVMYCAQPWTTSLSCEPSIQCHTRSTLKNSHPLFHAHLIICCSWDLLEPLSQFGSYCPECSHYHGDHASLDLPHLFQLLFQPLVLLKFLVFLLPDVGVSWDRHIYHHHPLVLSLSLYIYIVQKHHTSPQGARHQPNGILLYMKMNSTVSGSEANYLRMSSKLNWNWGLGHYFEGISLSKSIPP